MADEARGLRVGDPPPPKKIQSPPRHRTPDTLSDLRIFSWLLASGRVRGRGPGPEQPHEWRTYRHMRSSSTTNPRPASRCWKAGRAQGLFRQTGSSSPGIPAACRQSTRIQGSGAAQNRATSGHG